MFLILIFNGSVIVCDFGLLRGWEDNPAAVSARTASSVHVEISSFEFRC